jgi:hypothetical protein
MTNELQRWIAVPGIPLLHERTGELAVLADVIFESAFHAGLLWRATLID